MGTQRLPRFLLKTKLSAARLLFRMGTQRLPRFSSQHAHDKHIVQPMLRHVNTVTDIESRERVRPDPRVFDLRSRKQSWFCDDEMKQNCKSDHTNGRFWGRGSSHDFVTPAWARNLRKRNQFSPFKGEKASHVFVTRSCAKVLTKTTQSGESG